MTTFRNLASTLAIAICLAASWPCTAKESVSQDELSAQKEFLQAKLDANKELAQKDMEVLNKRVDAVDKRIDDQVSRVSDIGNSVDRFAAISGIIGILITVLLTLGGLIGYFSVVAKVRREAQEAAKNWLHENEKELRSRTETLHSNAREAISTTLEGVNSSASQAKAAMERLQKEIGRSQPDLLSTPENRKDTETLQRRSEELKSIPENSYSFDDWNTRAFAAYNAGQLERAALYWENAAKIPAAGAENSAMALFNQGVALGQLDKNDAAIAAFDQLIARYANDNSAALRLQVAQAMGNKGVAYGRMGNSDKEIATYEQVIDIFSTDPAPGLREQVVNAMVNKCITHGQMGDNDKEFATYDQVVDTYGTDPARAIREQVAIAMNGRGFSHLISAKMKWDSPSSAQTFLSQAKAALQGALERKNDLGMAWGNLAYVHWLLGEQQQAEEYFRSGLAAPEDGGEKLYKPTLNDIAMHPIPEDEGFKAMVERLWLEYQNKQAPNA